ncbi:uncharacterized protein STEHIDRAFT_109860 [Stereum hirsutum FP-91666 SS1]|uniref:uncharacterized protein n=1 Tax=Stereum hirsutum (strain FP-91666) TaxID=721885 RepID=UPI000440ABCD|nr:uncharacterized protein STEHIDRAFT_109860 [Stereum hirsutum FP-91666 SS1]EIM88021.1 hypothetical protein STEHIDRAFT_109860 [Stereum hirsutum FP-91666 SS1]
MTMMPTEAAPGQYHRPSFLSKEWIYYADPSEAPKPRTNYGMEPDDGHPRFLHGILILAKKDYRFSIPPGWHPHDLKWTDACESSLIVKIKDYKIPRNGRLEFRDMVMDLPGDTPPKRSRSFDVFTCNGDGIYPVEIIKDDQGVFPRTRRSSGCVGFIVLGVVEQRDDEDGGDRYLWWLAWRGRHR